MSRSDKSLREIVIEQTKATGVLPCIKLKAKDDFLAYAQAMYDGGARVIEVTMTTPGALEAIEAISVGVPGPALGGGRHGPRPGHRARGHPARRQPDRQSGRGSRRDRHGQPLLRAGLFRGVHGHRSASGDAGRGVDGQDLPRPARRAEVHDQPADGLSRSQPDSLGRSQPGNAAEFIRCGACAVSGARTFMDREKIAAEGIGWITGQVARYVEIVRKAKENLPELP